MTGVWDPGQYHLFAAERRRPFEDLVDLVRPVRGCRVADLGCGTGEATADLHVRIGASETVGVDSSAEMLAQARTFTHGGLHFLRADIAAVAAGWAGRGGDDPAVAGRFDVVFSNAALQWVPDHESLLPALVAGLVPEGQLAVQVPANFDHPSHTAADDVAEEEPFRSAIASAGSIPGRADNVLAPERYAVLLDALGATDQHVRLQVYGHRLESTGDVVEWVKGTLLTPYRKLLDNSLYDMFVARYAQRLVEIEGSTSPYFYPFKRILMWARF